MAADKSVIKRQRDRHFWQQQVEAWQQSGLRPSRYANQHRLCKAQFERWRYRLKREAKADVDFIPVQVEPLSSATHQHLVISGPSGLQLQWLVPLSELSHVLPWVKELLCGQ